MKSNEDRTPKTRNNDNYERNVLEFLDREIESSKPHPIEKKENDELDLLVSNLLKQAITESDNRDNRKDDGKEKRYTASPIQSTRENKPIDSDSTISKAVIEREFAQKTKEAPASTDSIDKAAAQKPVLTSVTAQKRKIPLIVLGVIGVLAIAGFIAYLMYSNSSESLPEMIPDNELQNASQASDIADETTGITIATTGGDQANVNNSITSDSSVSDADPAPVLPASSEATEQITLPSPTQKEPAVKKEEPVNTEKPSSSTQSTAENSKPAQLPGDAGTAVNRTSGPAPDSAPVSVRPDTQKASPSGQTAIPTPASKPKTKNPESPAVVEPVAASASADATKAGAASESRPLPDPSIQKQETANDIISMPVEQDMGTAEIVENDVPSEAGKTASSEIRDPLAASTNSKNIQTPVTRPGQNITAKEDEVPPIVPQAKSEDTRSKTVPSLQNAPGETEWIPAKLVSHVNPSYPRIALHGRVSGTVELKVTINETGKVTEAVPVGGPDIFYEEAVKAVMKWKYQPATQDGIKTASEINIKIRFNAK